MIKIDKTNINKYYKLVKEKLDEYFTFNVSPDKLKAYLSHDKNINRFISKSNLGDVENIKIVIKDIVDDLCVRKVMTYENYVNISIKPNINDILLFDSNDMFEYEKVLGDYSRVSLSKISIIDVNSRIFSVMDNRYIVLSNSDIENIKSKLLTVISDEISKTKYRFDDIGIEVKNNNVVDIKFNMNNNIDRIIYNLYKIKIGANVNLVNMGDFKLIKIT